MKRKLAADKQADYRSAVVASVVANANRDRKRRPRPFSPNDFMPRYVASKPKAAEELLSQAEMLNRMFGGRDLRKK